MRSSVSKKLNAVAVDLACQWLRTMVPESEVSKINSESVKKFEASQDQYVYGNGTRRLSAYSTRWFYKKLKAAWKQGVHPDFTLKSVLELG